MFLNIFEDFQIQVHIYIYVVITFVFLFPPARLDLSVDKVPSSKQYPELLICTL